MKEQTRRVLARTAIAGAIALMFLNQGFRDLVSNYRTRIVLEQQLRDLRGERLRLGREVQLVQEDPSESEYLVRKTLRYVKKGEVEYRLRLAGSTTSETK